MKKESYDLYNEEKMKFYLKYDEIKEQIKNLESLLSKHNEVNSLKFAKTVIFSHELQANNQIEGYNADIKVIDAIINNKKKSSEENQKIILNLYNGYKYILKKEEIEKNSLKYLYNILSDKLLTAEEKNDMGEYYRKKDVFIYNSSRVDVLPITCMQGSFVEEFMNYYFDFLNNDKLSSNKTDIFIKSQILHFYFVYVHPYYDVNGRCSRTTSMWYLLNNEIYPYIIFNRGISFKKNEYYKVISDTKKYMNLTYFVKYMLSTVQLELEKEILLQRLDYVSGDKFTGTDYQTLLYFLTMKGEKSILDFVNMYNRFNEKKGPNEIYNTMIKRLIDMNVIESVRNTSKMIGSTPNQIIKIVRERKIDKKEFDK